MAAQRFFLRFCRVASGPCSASENMAMTAIQRAASLSALRVSASTDGPRMRRTVACEESRSNRFSARRTSPGNVASISTRTAPNAIPTCDGNGRGSTPLLPDCCSLTTPTPTEVPGAGCGRTWINATSLSEAA